MDKTAEQKREENRKKYPWIAEFIDELVAAGFTSVRVLKIIKLTGELKGGHDEH